MRAPRCTIDSSCIIALDHLKLVPELSHLFAEVLVPKAVQEEVSKREATKDRLLALLENYAFFKRCDGYEKGAVDILFVERARSGAKDRGEAEAVVQASQFGAIVIVNDRWGEKLATLHDLETHGTLWVLQRFYELKFLSSTALRDCFGSLREIGLRLPWKIVDELLLKIGQPPL
jgi:predicted nucleic acid-binding protein